jgi:hypothetical protein
MSAYLAASLAHMGLLSSMNARVHSQSRTLNELLPTARPIASMRSYPCVDSF